MLIDEVVVIFDLETTDISLSENGTQPEIIEIGAVKIDRDFEILETFEFLVKPRHPEWLGMVPAMTGITEGELLKAPEANIVLEKFMRFTMFRKHKLASWGVAFDVPILKVAHELNDLSWNFRGMVLDLPSMMYGSEMINPKGLPKTQSLDSVCKHLGVERKIKHRALPDAIACTDVLKKYYGSTTEEFKLYEV